MECIISTYFISWLSLYFKKDKWKNIFHDVLKSSSYGLAEIDSSAEKKDSSFEIK